MTVMQQWLTAQDSPEVVVNENFVSVEHVAVYAKDPDTTSALTWGYLGGRWGGFAVTAGTLTLTNTATNYVVVARATGVISNSTATTNWNNATDYAHVYKLTAAGGVVTVIEDHRGGPGGVHGSGGGGGGGGGGTIGRQAIYISAAGMSPSATGGCAALATIASAANQPDIQTLDFDPTTQEYAQFGFVMPKKWNEGAITFVPQWSHAATTVNFGVVWSLQAVAVGNDDAIATAFGTAQTSSDTGGTTNDLYAGPESSAITVGGTPGAEEMVFFRLSRVTGDGGDTMAIDARLHGITVYVTTDAETDA